MWENALQGKLDDIDIRIVNMVLQNGRITDKDIADQLHVSKTAIRMRRIHLQKLEYIRFMGLLVLQNVNLPYADAIVKTRANAPDDEMEKLIKYLQNEENTYEVTEYLGEKGLLIRLFDRNLLELKRRFKKICLDNPIIESYEIMPVVRSPKAWGVKLDHK